MVSGERILSNISEVAKNIEVVAFLGMMMFAGTFWGFIEAFLFWHLDDLGMVCMVSQKWPIIAFFKNQFCFSGLFHFFLLLRSDTILNGMDSGRRHGDIFAISHF